MTEAAEQAKPTHIILRFEIEAPNQAGKVISEQLFRSEDGMLIAERQNELVLFGEDPKETRHRRFITKQAAEAFLRNIPRLLANEADPPPQQKDFPTGGLLAAEMTNWEARKPKFLIEIHKPGIIDPTPRPSERITLQ